MEIREWAERLLLGQSLAEKLLDPGVLTDETPGEGWPVPDAPGRPRYAFSFHSGLGLAAEGAPFPRSLETARDRGLVLHFFANHELLAIELMALTLLRFPSAPAPFRRGLAAIVAEEQRHLGLYLRRMEELGVEPGEIPVNAFFWRCLAGAGSPAEFLAGMSLTFEQANLDHALDYAARFAAAGDEETAALLRLVHDDEVGHVRHGLTWLRRWKDPGQDDWSAWTGLLRPPLTPARARGRALSRESRRRAGFSPEFVEELAVYAHSRGRTPRLFWFNPGCEEEIAVGTRLPAPALRLQRDLEALPFLLAAEEDAVLVTRAPGVERRRALQEAGLTLPEFVAFDGRSLEGHPLAARKLGGLEPWGWSPAAAALLAPLGAPPWDPARSSWHTKSAGAAALARLLAASRDERLCPAWAVGRRCASFGEAEDAVAELRARGLADVVIKADLGAAGRGATRLLAGAAPTPQQRGWLERILRQQGAAVVEAWLPKILDLSFHFTRHPDGRCRLDGLTRFFTDARGQYAGHHLGGLAAGLPPEQARFLYQRDLRDLAAEVGAAVGAELGAYAGPVGVDALAYRCPLARDLRLKPIVEINPRFSMGRIALALQRRVAPGASGSFRLARPAGLVEWAAEAPIRLNRGGQIAAGRLCLTDPQAAEAVVAVLEVGGF